MNFNIPITKIDQERRLVIGRATQEIADKTKEILDYASAKPAFETWSKQFEEMSGGMSKGNLRVMHGPVVAGKIMQMDFNDHDMAVDIVAKVVDDNEWKKVQEGVYTGFSIGGGYAKRWKDGDLTRYTPRIAEISLVDNPCVPSAKFYDLVKADGSVERRAFPQPELGDKVEFLPDQHGDGALQGKVVGIDGESVLVKHGDGQSWMDWPVLHAHHIHSDADGKLWVMKRSPEDEVTQILAKFAEVDQGAVAKAMRDFRAGELRTANGTQVVDRETAIAMAISAGRQSPALAKAQPRVEVADEAAFFGDVLAKWAGPRRKSRRMRKAFDESKIERDEDGKFDEKNGGGTASEEGHKARIKSDAGYRARSTQAINETRLKYAGAAAGLLGGGALVGGLAGSAVASDRVAAGLGRGTDYLARATGRAAGKIVGGTTGAVVRGVFKKPGDLSGFIGAGGKAGETIGAGASAAIRAAGRGGRGVALRAAGGSRVKASLAVGAAAGLYGGLKVAPYGYQAGAVADDFSIRRVLKFDSYGGLRKARVFNEADVVRDDDGKFTFKDGAGPVSAGAGAVMGGAAAGVAGIAAGTVLGRAGFRDAAAAAANELKAGAASLTGRSAARKESRDALLSAAEKLTNLAGAGHSPKTLAQKIGAVVQAAVNFLKRDSTIKGAKGIAKILAKNPSLAISTAIVGAAGVLKGREMLSQIGDLISNADISVGIGLDGPTVKVSTQTAQQKKDGEAATTIGEINPATGLSIARQSADTVVDRFQSAFRAETGDDDDDEGDDPSTPASPSRPSSAPPRTVVDSDRGGEPARPASYRQAETNALSAVSRDSASFRENRSDRIRAVNQVAATDQLDDAGRMSVVRALVRTQVGSDRMVQFREKPSEVVSYLETEIGDTSVGFRTEADRDYVKALVRYVAPAALKSMEVTTPNGNKSTKYNDLMAAIDRKSKASGPRDGDGDGKTNETRAESTKKEGDRDGDGKANERETEAAAARAREAQRESQRSSAPTPAPRPTATSAPRPAAASSRSSRDSEFDQAMETARAFSGLSQSDWNQLGEDERQDAFMRMMDSPTYTAKSFPALAGMALTKGHLIRPRRFSMRVA